MGFNALITVVVHLNDGLEYKIGECWQMDKSTCTKKVRIYKFVS